MAHQPTFAADLALRADLAFVRRLARALAGPTDADDLSQDVACALLERRRGATAVPAAAWRAWLAAVTRHLHVDRLRAERARAAREQVCARESSVADASDVVARGERHRRVVDAVLALAEPYRTTILLRYLDELSCAEVAARTGVPEATVRKRVERGLRRLRANLAGRLDRQAACPPLLLWRASSRTLAALAMKTKSLVAFTMLLVASLVWLSQTTPPDPARLEVGGRGVVASETSVPDADGALGSGDPRGSAGERTLAPPRAPVPQVRVGGRVWIDGVLECPDDLSIATDGLSRARVQPGAASWQLDRDATDQRVTLWVTAGDIVPAQIPVPDSVLARGGTFDLHLHRGRTLTLRFLDAEDGQPLAGLDFELSKGLELLRARGQVHHRAAESQHRTDAEGRAVLRGLAGRGYVRVVVDLVRRERHLVLRGGGTVAVRWPGSAVWEQSLDDTQPLAQEHTLRVRRPRGEARALGQLPGWLTAGDRSQALPVARELLDGERHGDVFALPLTADGAFELVASAPSRWAVWLERRPERSALSAPVEVEFQAGGEEQRVMLAPLQRRVVELVCANVPASGQLRCTVPSAATGVPRSYTAPCAGAPLTLRVEVDGSEPLLLHVAADAQAGKSGWSRQLEAEEYQSGRVQLDLAGAFRSFALVGVDPPLAGDGVLLLTPVRGASLDLRERVVVWCEAGRALQPVHVPPGRWLYHYQADGGRAVLGVCAVAHGARAPLPIEVRLQRVAAPPAGRALRVERVDGVALAGYPASLRTVASQSGEFVWLPLDCEATSIEFGK